MQHHGELALRVLVASALLALAPFTAHAEQNLQGVWSGVFTTQDNPFWNVEDFACFAGCPPDGYKFLQKLLDDPANDSKPFEALMGQSMGFMQAQQKEALTEAGLKIAASVNEANDPAQSCEPYAFAREVVNALPIQISRDGKNLVIKYEEWSKTRTIYLDGRAHPKTLEKTAFGHSIGHWEGDVLVVETVALSADLFYTFQSGGGYSDQARGHERYTVAENPRRLTLELTIEDPVNLKKPFVTVKTWLFTPDLELVIDSCKDFPARP